MPRPDRPAAPAYVYPNPSIPADLVALYREHADSLPPLAHAAAEGLRAELRKIGVEPPPPPPPTRTTAATIARAQQRSAAQRPRKGPRGRP